MVVAEPEVGPAVADGAEGAEGRQPRSVEEVVPRVTEKRVEATGG